MPPGPPLRLSWLSNPRHPPFVLLNIPGGVGALVAMFLYVRRRGGRLTLLRPSPRVCRVLRMTHLTNVFEIYEGEDEALCSFAPLPLPMRTDSHGVAAG